MKLKNKTVLITGASSGIGAACAKKFAEAGANLLLCARRLDLIQTLAVQLHEAHGVSVQSLQLDVREREQVKKTLDAFFQQQQAIDILINNAGLAAGLDAIQDADIDDWEAMIDTNVKGLLYMTREILPQMIANNSGHIVNIGSVAGHVVYPKGVVYCATKHAVDAITRGLRMDLFGKKIRVTTIDPGAVETNFSVVRFKGDQNRADSVYVGMEPLTPDDVADAVIYAVTRPAHVNISEMILMPTDQAAATMIARDSSSNK